MSSGALQRMDLELGPTVAVSVMHTQIEGVQCRGSGPRVDLGLDRNRRELGELHPFAPANKSRLVGLF